MKTIARESLNNIESYLNKERKAFYGMFQGKIPGGYCRIMTPDRSYFIHYIVNEKLERVFVDVYPQIIVEKSHRYEVHAYVNEKTSTYQDGRVDIDNENGELKIRVATSIVDHAVSEKDIEDMEHLAVRISDGLERRLDKMAHGVRFKEDDPDVMGECEKIMNRKKLEDFDDDDDSEEDPFFELLKRISSRRENSHSAFGEEDISRLFESSDFEEDTETAKSGVDVVLESYGENKFYVIKCVRDISGVSLPEAKHMVESVPFTILKNVSKEEAEIAVNRLEAEGAKAYIR